MSSIASTSNVDENTLCDVQFGFDLLGRASAKLEVSTDMVSWQPVATINAGGIVSGPGLTVTNFHLNPANYAARVARRGVA